MGPLLVNNKCQSLIYIYIYVIYILKPKLSLRKIIKRIINSLIQLVRRHSENDKNFRFHVSYI
jgi:hypothetical protein